MADLLPTHGHPDNPEVVHEHSDVNIRGILLTAGILVATAVVIHVVVWFQYVHLDRKEMEGKRSPFPLSAEQQGKLPGRQMGEMGFQQPILEGIENVYQGSPIYVQPRQLRPSQNESLTTYAPSGKGSARIPIDRAIQLLATDPQLRQKYLPSAAQPGRNGPRTGQAPGGQR